jgi:hypothetical protein
LKVQIDGEQDPKKWMFLTAERLYDDDVKTRLSFTASKAKNPSLTARWHIGNGGIADDRIAERFWRSIAAPSNPASTRSRFI